MVTFAAEPLFFWGSFPITNTIVHTLIVDFLLIGTAVFATKNLKVFPSGFQNALETLLETFYNLTESIAQGRASKIFPYVVTFFLFIFIANITSLLPGFGTIGIFEHAEHGRKLIPFLRGATSDLNVTLALAVVSVIATHMLSINITGIKDYLGRYFSLNPINLYVGILELVAELTKIVSLSFRLFGNIFAGEVALTTVSNIFAFVFPLPFLLLESIVAVVQALVFSMLTLVFMAVLTTPHHAAAEEVSHR